MKHQKEWHTCDRCGAEIKFKPRQQLSAVESW
nr:MAG TPA: acetyl-coA carboxylase zinc finger domain protein [Caudoviricetes sp.]